MSGCVGCAFYARRIKKELQEVGNLKNFYRPFLDVVCKQNFPVTIDHADFTFLFSLQTFKKDTYDTEHQHKRITFDTKSTNRNGRKGKKTAQLACNPVCLKEK